ncbi:hypothetical protein BELL_0761g00040 [Botrytis elliptica]|uniref:Uncharacterized protein n=1 Tax=Botrytis elliptica TaxID=278938 RepID=A0A4Z1JDV9_9HELO|nr:hypothetical protein BELL_0761g00040 [Botrytis elliptica]
MAFSKANLPNLRRLFVEARTDAEESTYSRNAATGKRRQQFAVRNFSLSWLSRGLNKVPGPRMIERAGLWNV